MVVDTKQPEAFIVIGTFLALSTFFIALRIWARAIQWKSDGIWEPLFVWSDGLLLAAYLLAVAESYVIIRYTIYTWQGYHVKDIPKLSVDQAILGQRYNLANQLLYNPILCLVKASVICFLLRIGGMKRGVKIALWITQAINCALAVAIFVTVIFQCSPVRYVFDFPRMDPAARLTAGADEKGMVDGKLIKGGTCINQINFFLISAGLTVATDIMVLVIPTVIVWDLQMARKQKIMASAILSVGVIVTGVSVARLVIYNWRFSPNNKDRSYGVGYTISNAEANLAIATGSVPSLGPLLRRFAPKLFSTTSATGASRPMPSSGYLQQSGGRDGEYAMKSFASNAAHESRGWKAKGQTEAWSSDENILPVNGTREDGQIRKNVEVEVSFQDAKSDYGGKAADKRSF